MLAGVELMQGIERFGREYIQSFVAKSGDMKDVVNYLRAEWILEMVKVTPFVTVDLVKFEKITNSPAAAKEG